MKLTTKDLVKILPFEDQEKTDLFQNFDSLDEGQKFEITRILWQAYDALYEIKLEENTQLAFFKAENNE